MWLSGQVAELGPFQLLSDGSQLPVFAFRVAPGEGGADGGTHGFTVYDVSERLRSRGWLVPAYPMPPAIEDVSVLRVVVRNGFGHDLASLLVEDLRRAVDDLRGRSPAGADQPSFHH